MDDGIEVLPKVMDGVVFFQFGCADAGFYAVFRKRLIVFAKNDGRNAFVLVFRQNPDEVKNHFFITSLSL